VGEECREVALGKLRSDLSGVAGLFEHVRVRVERHACACVSFRLKLGEPAGRDFPEGQPRREWQVAEDGEPLQESTLFASFRQRLRIDRAKRIPSNHHADGVLAVWLLVDPALDPTSDGRR
jgi:hypothetical protein